MTKHELEQEIKWLQIVIKQLEAEKDILWEYFISCSNSCLVILLIFIL